MSPERILPLLFFLGWGPLFIEICRGFQVISHCHVKLFYRLIFIYGIVYLRQDILIISFLCKPSIGQKNYINAYLFSMSFISILFYFLWKNKIKMTHQEFWLVENFLFLQLQTHFTISSQHCDYHFTLKKNPMVLVLGVFLSFYMAC